jgi:agmatine deiminase
MNQSSLNMPAEWEPHNSTWLQWPHNNTNKGDGYREKLDSIWVQLTKELHYGEKVNIVVCNQEEKLHVISLLKEAGVDLRNVDFLIHETDDIWIRDNGPIFVKDQDKNLVITNWVFNGWGNRYPYKADEQIPREIAEFCNLHVEQTKVCLEGGGIEVDGKGSFMAAKSSIINDNRNPDLTQKEIEEELAKYLGITNFIWITGIRGEDNENEVTDFHIDGAARFSNSNTILFEYDPSRQSPQYILDAQELHYHELKAAKNNEGMPYNLIPVPVTKSNVKEAGCRGSYLNYYVGNEVVLVPTYGDENDLLGLRIIEGQFPGRRVVGIDVCKLFAHGGMIHCVTQQQPK